jgi:hypothetical protein
MMTVLLDLKAERKKKTEPTTEEAMVRRWPPPSGCPPSNHSSCATLVQLAGLPGGIRTMLMLAVGL